MSILNIKFNLFSISTICYLFNKVRYDFIKKRLYMNIIINGQTRELKNDITLEKILEELGLVGKVMAAAVNMEIVKQDNWDTFKLSDGDKLELLDFVGGG